MDRSTQELLEMIRLTEHAASRLHALEEPQQIFDAVTDVFRESKRYNAHILLADGDDPGLEFVATSFSPGLVRLGELAAGVTMKTFRVDLDQAPLLARVFRDEETIQVSTTEILADFLPSSVVASVLRRMKYEGTVDMLTPLHRNGEIIGILSLTAPELAEHFIPSLKNLAHQIGAALQFAMSERERAGIEIRYKDLLENLNEIIYSIDVDERITFVSSSVSLMGRSQDELVEQPVDAIFEGANLERVRAWLRQFLDGRRVSGETEFRLRRSSGGYRWVRTSSRAILENGRPVGVRGSIIDITQEREAADALVESERRLSTLMSNLEGMAYRCKNVPLWTMEFVSEGSVNLTGYAPVDLVQDQRVAYGELIHSEDQTMVWERIQEALGKSQPFEVAYRIQTADRDTKWVWEQGRGVFDDDGCVIALEGFISDITEQHHTAETLRDSEERLKLALAGTIRVITQAAEARDPYTAGHQQRVAALAHRIAVELGLAVEIQSGLRVAGLMHDVGKISVPSEILAKPGSLSDVEMSLVRGHVEAGYQILRGIEFPWPIADIVLQHHERLDGSGYPHALQGEEICLEARILAVSDTVEAMSMHRPYRPALGTEAALRQIETDRETRLDSDVVDACLRLFRDKAYTLEQTPDNGWSMLGDFAPDNL